MSRAAALSMFLAILAPSSWGQLASTASFQLLDFALAGGGGGSCSTGFAGNLSLPPFPGGPMLSIDHEGEIGFLAGNDPQPTNAPVVFGVVPNLGPAAGGTPVTISGLNFDKFGVAPSVTVTVAGTAASAVNVLGDTQISCLTPAGSPGPGPVTVSSAFGSDTLPGGFVHTPAVISSPTVAVGGSLLIENYGPVGVVFQTYFSTVATSVSLPPFGTLLIGPSPLALLVSGAYPAPNGIAASSIPVPNDPALSGLVAHFQSVAILSVFPFSVMLTNRSTTTVL